MYQAAGYCTGDAGMAVAETVPQFCAQKAQAECQYVVPVCTSLTTAAWVSFRSSLCNQEASAATASGKCSFQPDNVTACLTAVGETYGTLNPATKTTFWYADIVSDGPFDTASVDYLCGAVFQGAVFGDGTCTSSFDCADDNVCTPASGGSSVSVCAPLNSVVDGLDCGAAGDLCETGDVCAPDANGEYVCRESEALGGRGAPCQSDAQCDPTTAGFCDIYAMTGCQPGYAFAEGKDCEAFGLPSGS
jgi:hypothetical protein